MSALDYNYNYNYTIGGQGGSGLRFRPRDNTDIYARLVNLAQPVVAQANYPLFPANWDPDLRSCMFLDDFLSTISGWRTRYGTAATNAGVPAQNMTPARLNNEVLQILQLALEREDRYAEVIDQDDGEGAINYFLGMLMIDPPRFPASNLMVRVGRRIGEHVAMCLKGDFRAPRPSQLSPAIEPMIDPPATPSFPAGHAIQSYLIAYLLAYSLPNLPQQVVNVPPAQATGLLFDLAARISQNRIVAGVHYPTDIIAGRAVATEIFSDVQLVSSIWGPNGLMVAVQGEFPQYR